MNFELISIIIPVYNEEKNISLLYAELVKAWKELRDKYDYEIIFVDDGSKDSSIKEIEKLAEKDDKVKYLQFSRNFGKELAITAGLREAKGNAAIMIDADLQHPAELIPRFIEKWKEGTEVVVGVRKKNKQEGLIKKTGSFLFYKIINAIAEIKVTPNATDFRLLDRIVINEFNRFTEKNRMSRALVDWLGFKRDYIYFNANARMDGKAGYGTLKLIKLALSGFISLSLVPLKIAGYLGIIIVIFSGSLGLFIFIEKYVLDDPWNMNFSYPSILAVINLFLIGVVLSCLGLVALYIANIHREVINRPMYIIRSKK
ncbi:MAG: glycosyltransferase family 2 protein [candidate division Zixibacteria bacterium]|nr:glycosyltransferase family 2 protein [candidate division Zixibacteria bacterium]